MLGSTFVPTSGLKNTRPNPQMAAILKISKYLRYIHFDIRYGKNIANYYIKSVFDVHDVTDDVTALGQIVPFIFMFKWNCHTFRDTSRSFQPIVTKLGPYL